jgi:hypothetical protein
LNNLLLIKFQKTILTLNQNGKRGVVLAREQYDCLRDFIISTFESKTEITFEELMSKAIDRKDIYANENSMWYLLKVKTDLQARGILRVRFMGVSPRIQILKINKRVLRESGLI